MSEGRGLWKFNNSLLTDKEYVSKVKETIHSVCSQYLENIGSCDFQCKNSINESLFLEVLMMEIRGVTISYSAYKKKEKDNREKILLQEIEALEFNNSVDIDLLDEKKKCFRKSSQRKITRSYDKVTCSLVRRR